MNTKLLLSGFLCMTLATTTIYSCKKDKSGCTDSNADNFDSGANQNSGCRYRYASNIDIDNVPANKPDGSKWDDSDGPDLRINFGKSSSSGFDYSTDVSDNYSTGVATVHPNSGIRFSNETWKFQLVDGDLLSSEIISEGTFNPVKGSGPENSIAVTGTNGATFKFKYTIQ
jgi:hypothetical protein